ncbi:MAG TPA: hypothetical protein VK689_01265, partial [Armatimonadota bacterium]|nr:hypothetical protein [Armatimonadota bacterium]
VESPPQWRRASVVTVLAVVGISFFSQYRGWLAIRHDLEENQALVQTVEGVTSPLLVTDVWWLGAEVAAADFQATQVLVEDSDGDRALLAAVLREMSPQSFTYLGRPHGFGLLSSAAEQNGWGYAPGAVRQQVGLVSAVFQRQETRKERPPFASPSSFRGRRP